MRKIDKIKSNLEKVGQTISFDKIVLIKLEERAKKEGSTISNLVNTLCRQVVLTDQAFYKEMAKYHYLKFQENKYMQEQAQIIVENK